MDVLEIKVVLPESLAREAEANGLLSAQVIERLLREELRRKRVDDLFASADRLAATDEPPMTEAEVEAEIQAARAARHKTDARDS